MIPVKHRRAHQPNLFFDPFAIASMGHRGMVEKGKPSSKIFTNILKNEEGFVIELAAPGFQKNDFNIDVEKNQLKVTFEKKEEEAAREYTKQEFQIGSFSKSFTLPNDIDLEKISARYELGILKIELIRVPTFTKKITVA